MLLGLVACAAGAVAAPTADRVTSIPGFKFPATFDVFSGYLHVPGPIPSTDNPNSRGGASGCSTQPYDSLSIHYQLNMAQGGGATKPVVAWHQGGPGGSSTQGGMIEMSYFQVDDKGTHTNPFSWNHAANMLYLESPAGSGGQAGFSTCLRAGKVVDCCWDDRTHAASCATGEPRQRSSLKEEGRACSYSEVDQHERATSAQSRHAVAKAPREARGTCRGARGGRRRGGTLD